MMSGLPGGTSLDADVESAKHRLKVGDTDRRGNRVTYIYAVEPDYILYSASPGVKVWDEGVQWLLSEDRAIHDEQLERLLPLRSELFRLSYVLAGSSRRPLYDAAVAATLQLVLSGDVKSRRALDSLREVRVNVTAERDISTRTWYAGFLLAAAIVALVSLVQMFLSNSPEKLLWIGALGGVLGAAASLLMRLSSLPIIAMDIRDRIIRVAGPLLFGAICGVTLVMIFIPWITSLLVLPAGEKRLGWAMAVGCIAGFGERLVSEIDARVARAAVLWEPAAERLEELAHEEPSGAEMLEELVRGEQNLSTVRELAGTISGSSSAWFMAELVLATGIAALVYAAIQNSGGLVPPALEPFLVPLSLILGVVLGKAHLEFRRLRVDLAKLASLANRLDQALAPTRATRELMTQAQT
jgi:hypothetical protein